MATGKCKWCDLGWELGRFGCHYEPLPLGWPEDEEFYRLQANCQDWSNKRKEFYGY